MEHSEFEPAPTWDAGITGRGLTSYITTLPLPHQVLLYKLCWTVALPGLTSCKHPIPKKARVETQHLCRRQGQPTPHLQPCMHQQAEPKAEPVATAGAGLWHLLLAPATASTLGQQVLLVALPAQSKPGQNRQSHQLLQRDYKMRNHS